MKDEILKTISETLLVKNGELRGESKIEEIAKDSMDLVELVAVLSNKYRISINPQELNSIQTVNDIVEYVKKHQNNANPKRQLDRF